MTADLISAMQDAGGTLAQTLASGNAVGSRTRYGTVKKNNGTTLDVELCGATLAAVPMLTTCVGAAAGDRCILTIDGALVTVTGIIANAGNAPYVKSLWSGSAAKGTAITVDRLTDWALIGATIGGDGATIIGARYPGAGSASRCEYHCSTVVLGKTTYWAQLVANGSSVTVSAIGSGSGDARITNIYGILKG